jgi:bifunctional N-acetylglucosamine-1-phosphate-uridyltransferase/glucosamine-1-phosphate-acetyltransferase GlmU-like protein
MSAAIGIDRYIAGFAAWGPAQWQGQSPWQLTAQSAALVRTLLAGLERDAFVVTEEIAIHRTATVEPGAVLKGPLIVGPGCFVAASAYLRGGCWLDANCIVGPGAELKSSFVFAGSKLAHFNFVGDSILGRGVNLEAGAIVCNYRNERADKEIRVRIGDQRVATGVDKFGALIGDGARLGANAVVAPGALLAAATVVPRAALLDQDAPAG